MKVADMRILPLLIIFTFAVFANALGNRFAYDVHFLIEMNYSLRDWSYFSKIFTDSHAYDIPWLNVKAMPFDYYRPFRDLVQALAFHAFGLNTFYWHLLNLSIFSVVVTLSYAVIKRLSASTAAAIAAVVLFIVHPIHSEVVAWVNCL